ncbi:hypothetical protein HU200_039724 [Digitaria exilis]|uniref:Receptor kinase-like protein Xa21 n=1 Tax=Digitaria exilis TaxID=1010633 RepID=A0A835EJF2_9POAL|nr:hypothetical protein HU200_039724 [Digitaria exilis]
MPELLLIRVTGAELLLLLLLPHATATIHATLSAMVGGDERALLDFKAKITSHSGALASWNTSNSYCDWEGVRCGRRHPQKVVALDLQSKGLVGTISPAIGNLTFLCLLNLSFNSFHGQIPPTIGYLRRLEVIYLRANFFAGTIPSNISNCTSLRQMLIGDNNMGMQGGIPAEIGSMASLTVLELPNNGFTGTIPSSLGNLSRLTALSLSGNYLQGSIPHRIGNNPSLQFLQLSRNNLSGLFPPSLYNLSSLYAFHVDNNKLHGHLPADLGTSLPSIELFSVGDNQFTGVVPSSISNLSSIQIFYVNVNRFNGVFPSKLGRLQNLIVFILDDNKFEANNEHEWEFFTSLVNCSMLQIISIGWNMFAGNLPVSIANFSTNLQRLRFLYNNISGTIPSGIQDLVSLQELDLRYNLLTGSIPESIGKLTYLNHLYFDSNYFSGHIPSSIGNLSVLDQFGASANRLEGPIPSSIGDLNKLSGLDLSNNKLSGFIPNEVMHLSSITILLDLSYNLLEGPLPSEVGNLANLGNLILSGNQLSGQIPDTISNCIVLEFLLMDGNLFQGSIPAMLKNIKGLTLLNLTENKLNGSIPGDLGSIVNLHELYLAHNDLSGPIPEILGNSTSLLRLDLSFNNLQGEVPKEGVFKNLTGLSIVGNSELCGGIPQLHLPQCPDSPARKNKNAMSLSLRIAVSTTGPILILFSGLSLAVFLCRRSKVVVKKIQLPSPFTEIDLPMISYNTILRATDGFSDTNLLGKGRYGSVYKGTIENFGVPVAVKVFNLQQPGSYKSFQAECEALRRVRHRCLVKVITSCASINHQGQDFRALVFEFMPNGSLDSWIHSDTESQSGRRALTLEQRLDIAVDIADAIDYLHTGCQTSIIHCDLKPGNILIAQDIRACVGDFGIARILNEAARTTSSHSNSIIGIRGSIGYVAPEYGEGLAVSTYGDVYSLGITLIDMFTGRSRTDDIFRDGLSLHYFAKAALPDKVMEIVDSRIWLHDEANKGNGTRDTTRTKECLAAVIQLGVMCSKQSPRERLLIRDAALEMRNIRNAYLSK